MEQILIDDENTLSQVICDLESVGYLFKGEGFMAYGQIDRYSPPPANGEFVVFREIRDIGPAGIFTTTLIRVYFSRLESDLCTYTQYGCTHNVEREWPLDQWPKRQ